MVFAPARFFIIVSSMRFRSLFAVALLSTAVRAQPKPVAGLKPRLLGLTTDSLEIYVVRQADQQRSGTIVDALDTVRVNGELRFRRVYTRTDDVLGNGVDTLVDAFADITLRTVDSRSEGGGVEHLEYRNGRFVGTLEQSGSAARPVDTGASGGGYSSASFDLLLRSAPLANGYSLSLPAFSGRQGWKIVSAKVTGSETLPQFGETWRINADFGGRTATFWITKDSRRLVRQLINAAPGIQILIVAPH
jgi:hypothetical protein